MSKTAVARAGRPRDENVHRAILDAARGLIRDQGYGSFSIEGVAARAGVAKQSIYRRWSSKGALLVDLYMDGLEQPAPMTASGLAADLLAVVLQTTKRVQDPAYANMLKSVVVEAQSDADMRELVLQKIVEPRRDAAKAVIEQAIVSGELPGGLDSEMVVDFIFGAVWFNLLLGDVSLTSRFAHRLVRTIELFSSHQTPRGR
jgi:AcrR family transcriptional regulator